ncbi:condensin complex subunit 2 [Nematocida displodere]|uniref:Condensin complex subunit 2 n=1 Tax=Nematocida displodere TaxID=1805483 RepID=A0A177EHS8_9MICR|nr:condensin complex subunit 2 [Nematocida displodere]
MAEKEVAQLIKESAECKISIKNTWSSTLIDEFSNIERFKEKSTDSTNFQHASIVLDGCVRVYSTRVDSVVDEADKLMELVGRAKDTEKPKHREKIHSHPTIESNPEVLALKKRTVSADDEILEYLSRESKEGDTRGLLMHLLKWSDEKGLQVLQTGSGSGVQETGELDQPNPNTGKQVDFIHLLHTLFTNGHKKAVSPMFVNFTPDKGLEDITLPTYAYQISYDNEQMPQYVTDTFPADFDSTDQEVLPCEATEPEATEPEATRTLFAPSQGELRLSITPFGYFKGWAGPAHWKVQGRRKPSSKGKEKKKAAAIDFLKAPTTPLEYLFERDEKAVISPQQITERRKNSHTLPPDYNIKVEDLYKMFIYPGNFYHRTERPNPNTNQGPSNEQLLTPPEPLDFQDLAPGNSPDAFTPPALSPEAPFPEAPFPESLLSRRLLQSTLRKARKNNIVEIKQSLWSAIEGGERQVDKIYTEMKEKEVSVHFYLVSLLHLANEKNFTLTHTTTDTHTPPHISQLVLAPQSTPYYLP